MIDFQKIDHILEERKDMHPDDPRIIDKWNELIQILTQNEHSTIAYFNSCSKEKIFWLSEVFEDISEKLQSIQFIECIEKIEIKYPDLELELDIAFAKEALK